MEDPIVELKFALDVLQTNSLYETRFNEYVVPMVYGELSDSFHLGLSQG